VSPSEIASIATAVSGLAATVSLSLSYSIFGNLDTGRLIRTHITSRRARFAGVLGCYLTGW